MALNVLPIFIFKLCAGIGLFLFAMYLIEESLKNLSGRNFKLFLQRSTKNRFGAVAGGAIVTAVLQSSSMVSLMVLAFVGAGVLTMRNAMAIILGANLGTTLDSWLVATLGFKMDIEVAAYPAIFCGGMLLILFGKHIKIKYSSYFLLGFGLLFIGLSFMKTAMEAQVKAVDLSQFAELSLFFFLVIGFIITSLVQSSSVTMALTLSALFTGAIGFAPAAAIVLGSETGTTIKILLGSIGGSAAKKRVALGNLFFNIFLTVMAFAALGPILSLITDVFAIKDPLIGLVTFSTLINLVSISIFLPFLGPFTSLLEKFFTDSDRAAAAFIGSGNSADPETALDLFQKETEYFLHNSIHFNLALFDIDNKALHAHSEFEIINERKKFFSKNPEEKYEFLKQLHGELQTFYLSLRDKVQGEQSTLLDGCISTVRNCMHSIKSMKDVASNIDNLRRSSIDVKFQFFHDHKKSTASFYQKLTALMEQGEKPAYKEFQSLFSEIKERHSVTLNAFYKEVQGAPIADLDLTTALNFNQELFVSNEGMLNAVKDFTLQPLDRIRLI
jgi:phosphate:Na+ symporter